MAHVFIAYSKKNADYATRLADMLREKGFDVWIDRDRLRTSNDWWRAIVSALWSCSAMVVILTPDSDASEWVQREITIAFNRSKPIYPVLLEGDIETHNWQIFLHTQYADVTANQDMPKDEFFSWLEQSVKPTIPEKPKVFISYRREPSFGIAHALHDKLESLGVDAFIDVNDIYAGSFAKHIETAIIECDYFIVILDPKTLESKWVVTEVKSAQEHNRIIIPVFTKDFDLYSDEVPDDLKFLQDLNAVELSSQFFDAAVERIAKFIKPKK